MRAAVLLLAALLVAGVARAQDDDGRTVYDFTGEDSPVVVTSGLDALIAADARAHRIVRAGRTVSGLGLAVLVLSSLSDDPRVYLAGNLVGSVGPLFLASGALRSHNLISHHFGSPLRRGAGQATWGLWLGYVGATVAWRRTPPTRGADVVDALRFTLLGMAWVAAVIQEGANVELRREEGLPQPGGTQDDLARGPRVEGVSPTLALGGPDQQAELGLSLRGRW